MNTTAVSIMTKYNSVLSFAKPNGTNPIIPPTATLVCVFSAVDEAIITMINPMKIKASPIGKRYLFMLFWIL